MATAEILAWADGTANTEAYWSERQGRWVFVDFLNHGEGRLVESWVELTLDEDRVNQDMVPDGLDAADCGLNQATIACDLEGRGVWVVDLDDLVSLTERYGQDGALTVRRVGSALGEVLTEGEAFEAVRATAELAEAE